MREAGTLFIHDTHPIPDLNAVQIAEKAIPCAQEVQRFGIHAIPALFSDEDFGASGNASPVKKRKARA